jgi:uncharacterized protein YuzE
MFAKYYQKENETWFDCSHLRTDTQYEDESVNRPQMDMKRKICGIRIWKKKTFTSQHILHQH